jgi:Tol biopolymer transport system component/predicted amidohydrolase
MAPIARIKATPIIVLTCLALLLSPAGAEEGDEDKEPGLPLEGKTELLTFSTDEGSWLSIDITPDGNHLVFDLLGDLYRLPAAGGEATRLTSGLGFDSQPVVSPDGGRLAFVSDRDGADNLWIANIDGSDARKLSDEKQWGIISPAWSADGQYVVVTRTAEKPELRMYHAAGGKGVTLAARSEEEKFWGVGVTASPDRRHLYFAQGVESDGPVTNFPVTQIVRYDLTNGALDPQTQSEGGAVRPVLSADGSMLVYGTRLEAQTGLRIRDLESGADRWLTYPVQRDAQENARVRPPSRDLLPGYTFTPDGQSVIFNAAGKIWKVDVASGEKHEIPFTADVELDVGPDLTAAHRVPQGDLTATLMHDPMASPDGKTIAASVLARIYTADTDNGAAPRRLTSGDAWEFKPVWSPDGRWIAYVTWSMNDGGHIWRRRANGAGSSEQLTDIAAFYTDIVYAPDGASILAMRGSEFMRHQTFSEFGGLDIPLNLVSLPADGGTQTVIASASGARTPHFGRDPGRVYLYDDKGLYSIKRDGSDRRDELVVNGPRGNQRDEDPPQAEAVKISPDGDHALALVNKQIWLLAITRVGNNAAKVDVTDPALPAVRLTDIGADFFGWTRGGDTVWWAIGNTWFERDLDSIELEVEKKAADEKNGDDAMPFVPGDEHEAVRTTKLAVVVPRHTPSGSLLLQGVNVIAMSGNDTSAMDNVRENQDILITDNRIAAVGPSGTLTIPRDAEQVAGRGKYVVPGYIDTHAHWEFRTGDVLEPHNWTLVANLAYGVTAGLDVQTSHKDYLAYRDFVETGQSVGQRAFMTAIGIFGSNDFQSYDATHAYLRRYNDHYRTPNIKSYVVGNREQRQWVVLASQVLGLMPTTEGGADQKLDLTHAIDGMHGNEHTLPDSPLFKDVVELFAQTRTAYTPTLIVQYNAESLREYFFTRTEVHDDPKLQRFYPHNRLDELTRRRPGWQRDDEFQFRQAAAQAAKIQRAGGLVGVGGHAELQGLGYHWEMWAYEMGGMQPVEVLRAATIDAARILGVDQDLGSIEAGKLADMVLLDDNPLENIRNTTAIDRVIQNGRLYDGDTLDQLWPETMPLAPFWWWSADDRRFQPAAESR